jgi:hypothetical protein
MRSWWCGRCCGTGMVLLFLLHNATVAGPAWPVVDGLVGANNLQFRPLCRCLQRAVEEVVGNIQPRPVLWEVVEDEGDHRRQLGCQWSSLLHRRLVCADHWTAFFLALVSWFSFFRTSLRENTAYFLADENGCSRSSNDDYLLTVCVPVCFLRGERF